MIDQKLSGLLANPLFMGGLGLLGSGGVNPVQHALLGIQSAQQTKDKRLNRDRLKKQDERRSVLDAREDDLHSHKLGEIERGKEYRSQLEALSANPNSTWRDYARVQAQFGDPSAIVKAGMSQITRPQEGQVGTVNPRDYTAESVAKYQKTGNMNDLVRYEPYSLIDLGGGRQGVIDRTTGQLAGQPIQKEEFNTNIADAEASKKLGSVVGTHEGETITGAGKASLNKRLQEMGVENVRDTIAEAKELSSGWSTSYGSMLSRVPGTEAKALKNKLQTIKANIGFDKLQAMREASPTGGALGQVAVQELEGLQATIGSLDQAQTEKQLDDVLGKIDKHYSNWLNVMEQHYDSRYGGKDELETLLEKYGSQ